jgi:ligand-binding sensor domain-containing protein
MKKKYFSVFLFGTGLFCASLAQSITNFASPKGVYDFEFSGDVVWVATSGGLYSYNTVTDAFTLRPSSSEFPDPSIRALCRDSRGNLWAGSRRGYLLMRDPNGKEYFNYSYISAGWSIADMVSIGHFLVVASEKGISVFDCDKRIVIKNAARIGNFVSSQMYVVAIHGNTLYVGGESGMARLTSPADRIEQVNFYDPSMWAVDSSVTGPVHSFFVANGKLKGAKGASGVIDDLELFADSSSLPVPLPVARTLHYPNNVKVLTEIDTIDTGTFIDSAGMTGGTLLFDTSTVIRFESPVTVIKNLGGNRCWIGTESNTFYYWEGDSIQLHSIDGPTFSAVHRLWVDRVGGLWVLPYGIISGDAPWWLGINYLYQGGWWSFGPASYPDMGNMSTGTNAFGILETRDGSMWFGVEGGQIKRYTPNSRTWSHYCVFGNNGDGGGAFVKTKGPCPSADWGKCDALAQDSAGYVWISSWENAAGALICYWLDSRETDSLTLDTLRMYRRFPPLGGPGVNITAITVDKGQRIIYGMEKGELVVAEKVGDPLRDPLGLRIIKRFDVSQKVHKAVSLGDGSTLVVTTGGIYRFDPSDLSLSTLENFPKGVSTLAAENDAVLWYNVSGGGVIRHDVLKNEKTTFTVANGLASNAVNDLFIDKKKGCIWIATDVGVSRLMLGYASRAIQQKSVIAFPNPFSRKAHSTMYFRNIPPDGTITIHSIGGALVGKPERLLEGDGGASFRWVPPARMSPGTYFYAVVSPKMRITGKIILTP